MDEIRITIDGETRTCLSSICVHELLAPDHHDKHGCAPIAALVNNDLVSLSYPLTVNSTVEPLTMASPHGWRVYRRSLAFLLAKAVQDVYPESCFSVQHSFGLGLYCQFTQSDQVSGITEHELATIRARMHELVELALPIERQKLSYMDAVDALSSTPDKASLLRHRNPPRVVLHVCDDFFDLAHGPLAPDTGLLSTFELIHYEPGFVLHLPDRNSPSEIPAFQDQPHLFHIYQEHKRWGCVLGVNTVGHLNTLARTHGMGAFIQTAEALHERKLAAIAEMISQRDQPVRVVLVAGPSSAGKTTFAKRLSTHLRVHGMRPMILSTDDYFVGERCNPKNPDGTPDYEHIEAVDIAQFNGDLEALFRGDTVPRRHFDFQTKMPQMTDASLALGEDGVLIVEGIHGLNPRLAEALPCETVFRIYVSALTQLSLDANNRISTTDNRLMRRLVRDHRYRGHSALETLQLWPMVRRGEKQWIFPFQHQADATFNSALDYELAVLKPLVGPLLTDVKPCHPEYAEARRLSEFLLNFAPIPDDDVPPMSILREYIGGSTLDYD